ncbi:hypothetical protein INS49_011014 [Diaporthe citri]|uniref:uncharacterized protein n=1 Tax=Diaporthe citri TaxID=83186 RepID=UPI001C80767D|nr:uncharacterized protein INS49_011014 [Diaporthe citri]KAG6359960.1 hypothetical protein INS49_011014 [Diaporthe citri]
MSPKIHGDPSEGKGEPSFSAPPPSYSEATVPGGSQPRPPTYNEKPATDPIDELVSRLPSLVRERQQSQASQQLSQDDTLVQHMMPFIREFFLDFSMDNNMKRSRNSHKSLSMELMLVPQDAAPSDEGWTLAGLNEREEQSAFFRLSQIAAPGQLRWVSKDGESIQIRDDTAEADLLWWRDEEHALQLASDLRGIVTPERSEKSEAQRREVMEQQQEIPEQPDIKGKSPVRSFFGLSRKSRSPVEPVVPKVQNKSFATVSLGSVQVDVRAEEATFRRENDFGLWESSSGWAVVIKATVLY